jgi:hypothetical protein
VNVPKIVRGMRVCSGIGTPRLFRSVLGAALYRSQCGFAA